MSPSTYKKLIANRFSKHFREVAEIVEAPLPQPQSGEVLVKHIYAGVNATDVNIAAGLYDPTAQLPIDLGGEIVGQVVAVGEGVTDVSVDSYVVAIGSGGYAEYSIFKASRVFPIDAPKPEYLSMILSGLTAAFGLYITGEMTTGETVLVTAAAGGTGQYAVQLAKLAGNHVIGTCSTDDKAEFLKSLGCDRVINYKKEDLQTVLKTEYPKGVDIVYESVGKDFFDVSVKALAVRGRLVIIGYISEYMDAKPERIEDVRIYHRLLWKSACIRGMFFNHYVRQAPEHMIRLMTLYREGKLHIAIDPTEFVGLESAADAVEYLHSGASHGKVVVKL